VNTDHAQQSVSGWQPSLHDRLHQRLASWLDLVLVLGQDLDGELLDQLQVLLLSEVHDRRDNLEDRVQHELDETAGVALGVGLCPLLLRWRVEVVAPEALHQLWHLDLELGRVELGELLEGERPSVEASAETDCALGWVDGDVAHWPLFVTVCGDDDVDVLDNTLEGLEEILWLELELEESAIHLVHEEDRLDTLGDGLAQDGLGLYAHT